MIAFFKKTYTHHLIPDFSVVDQNIIRHLQIHIFDSADPDLAFLKKTGEKYQIVTSEGQDMVFAIFNSKNDPRMAEKLGRLIELAVKDSIGLESMQQVHDFARKKQIQIFFEKEQSSTQ